MKCSDQARAKAVVEKFWGKPWKQRLAGGLAVGKRPSDFSKRALVEGVVVELEHTDDPEVAMEIAMDHLVEFPDYYERLKKIEKRQNIFIFDELLLGGAAIAALKSMKKRGKTVKKLEGKHALQHLDKAIDMHRKHISGDLPTTAASQDAMMQEMIEARYALAKELGAKKKNPVDILKRELSR